MTIVDEIYLGLSYDEPSATALAWATTSSASTASASTST
jgi:hypothetical protein